MLRLAARWAEASSRAVNLPRRQSASVGDHAPKPSLEASVSMMTSGGGLQWKESGMDGLVLSTEIHQEISWRNVGDVCAPLRLVERRIAWAMCGRPHNTTRVSHSSVPASDCHCFCEANSRVC
jgi:hypothetical protein